MENRLSVRRWRDRLENFTESILTPARYGVTMQIVKAKALRDNTKCRCFYDIVHNLMNLRRGAMELVEERTIVSAFNFIGGMTK